MNGVVKMDFVELILIVLGYILFGICGLNFYIYDW